MLFQLTRPRGTRQSTQTHGSGMSRFNSRVRGGRDPERCRVAADTPQFQLTRPRGTRLSLQTLLRLSKCFNSRVRGGRDPTLNSASYKQVVSTHASAGDATQTGLSTSCPYRFQLTRPRGTRRVSRAVSHGADVSTHASAGDATDDRAALRRHSPVSTHASAGDATGGRRHSRTCSCFNSRVRGGRDSMSDAIQHFLYLFQLTRPRGTRLIMCITSPSANGFQLTRPRGTRPISARILLWG